MYLNLRTQQYDQDIYPHIKNGIIIDTSVFKIIVDGTISTRFSKKKSEDLDDILLFLDYLKMNNKWNKFLVTPHVLTEVCNHLHKEYSKWKNFPKIVKEILPIMGEMVDEQVTKDKIINLVNPKNPVLEIGDISIFVAADNITSNGIKIAVLANDEKLNKRFEDNKDVLVLDYKNNLLNFL